MKFETVKTVILIVLIATSLLLTFGMWNYQPNYKSLNNSPANATSLNGSEEFIWTLIEPNQAIFHIGNHHYGFSNPHDCSSFFQEIKDWGLNDFTTEDTTVEADSPSDYDMELRFPTPLPMEVMDGIFKLNTSNVDLPTWSFEEVYYSLNEDSQTVSVEFLSIDGRAKATAVIEEKNFYELLQSYIDPVDLMELALFNEGASDIYIPKDKVSLSRQTKTVSPIEPNDLVDVLFQDPSIVRQSTSSNRGITYFTDSSQLRVTQGGALMEFVSPAGDIAEPLFAEDLLNKSIAHINSYSGWTDDYKLMDINVNYNYISYQMHYLSYPVFGQFSTLEQIWGQRLIEYQRPLFRIDNDNFLNENTVELSSGEDIIYYLTSDSNYELENIKDIQLGYQLNYKSSERLAVFDPSWFILYGSDWIAINPYEEEINLQGGD
ncbi:YycH family regulatory protein [Oceanobacillus halophilus]|uniref:Regulatory protein YycH domain-containing protein n=1 Tax=Oceanobacillus halophilus TaxID=930130 RepID=A0A495A0M0_9BACI|nr:two-component system activity regulator YycH [Oceanobacillus halophilus]RKQ32944.1 hypothetical protein D8M06_11125 [Oceanobacillus halophilus]